MHTNAYMNTKVNKLTQLYNMQSHKAKAIVQLLDHHLPKRCYTESIKKECAKKGIDVTDQVIRNVRSFRTKDIKVLNLIVEFAQEHEAAHKKLQKSINH